MEGIRQFMAAAVNLTEVEVDVTSVEDAALADSVLCASKSVLTIRSEGNEFNTYMPQKLPPQVQQLEVLSIAHLARQQRRAILQPRFEAFLGMVSSMHHLRILSISCAALVLRCSVSLPRLTKASLRLRVCHGKRLDLSWLHNQHHDHFHLCLVLDTCSVEVSQRVMAKLQQIHISHLHLVVSSFPVASQQIWQTFGQCDSFHLEFSWQESPDVVHALPLCDSVTLTDGRSSYNHFFAQGPLTIMWQALARPGRLHVCQHNTKFGVQVQGFAHPSLNSLAAPWQLVVHAVAGIKGLPPSQPVCAPATHYLSI